jgi:hypothetical protein
MLYLRDGDANTKLFHLQSSHKMRKKFISKLEHETGVAVTQQEKEQVLYTYFSAIMGTPPTRTEAIDLAALGFHQGPHQAHLHLLDAPFAEEEIWSTIRALPGEKSPGPDGYTAEFYKTAWPVIKEDVLACFNALYRGSCGQLHRLNAALITLLPKKPDAAKPGDYRLISLIHSFAKLIAKLLANSLAPHLDQLIDVNQSAFIKKRSIHDNFKFVEQAARILHRKRKAALLLKLDISKAFDTVAWPFLLQLLQVMGFGPKWRDWISALLSTASTKVLLNGNPGRLIHNARGLRQGDPLSPMLFIMLMEVLHRLFKAAIHQGVLSAPPDQAIQHQCSIYADDVILFAVPQVQDLVTIVEILHFFGNATGLHTNLQKSVIAPIACSEEQLQTIQHILPAPVSQFPITYLGLPLSVTRLRNTHFQYLVDKVVASICWPLDLRNG